MMLGEAGIWVSGMSMSVVLAAFAVAFAIWTIQMVRIRRRKRS